jgi:hypothetical protein
LNIFFQALRKLKEADNVMEKNIALIQNNTPFKKNSRIILEVEVSVD